MNAMGEVYRIFGVTAAIRRGKGAATRRAKTYLFWTTYMKNGEWKIYTFIFHSPFSIFNSYLA